MNNVGIYIRKSRDSKNQKSLKEQRLLGTEFCTANNFTPLYYDDGIVSGAGDTDKRPKYNEMVRDIENGKLHAIYIWNSDRVAREEITWDTLALKLRENNVVLYDNGTLADFNDNNTMLFYGMKSSMDAHFARVTATKIKAVLSRNADEGNFTGILKYGYQRLIKGGATVIEDDEAKVVKMIFDLCINGKGFTAIAQHLNKNEVPTRYGKLHKKKSNWTNKVVGDILRSKNYIGIKTVSDKERPIPQIIDLKIFNKAQERIDKRKNKHGKQSFKKYLLNDILICGKCGKRYTGRKVSNHLYYRCASRIKKGGSCGSAGIRLDYLDKLIWDYFFRNPQLLRTLYTNFKDENNTQSKESIQEKISNLKSQLKSKEKQKVKIGDDYLGDIFTKEEANTHMVRIRKAIEDLSLQLGREEETLYNLNQTNNQITNLEQEIKDLHQKTPFNQKKEFLEKHLKEITIINTDGYYTINVTFRTIGNGYTERFIADDKYNPPSKVDIIQDDKIREIGFKNMLDFSINGDEYTDGDFTPQQTLVLDDFGFYTFIGQ